ncbi:hypothetical protein BJX65DRAFT_156734 [Aspergillus insuetus]
MLVCLSPVGGCICVKSACIRLERIQPLRSLRRRPKNSFAISCHIIGRRRSITHARTCSEILVVTLFALTTLDICLCARDLGALTLDRIISYSRHLSIPPPRWDKTPRRKFVQNLMLAPLLQNL